MQRKQLKFTKWKQQKGLCFICHEDLPDKNAVLDRLEAMIGYTVENTRLLLSSMRYFPSRRAAATHDRFVRLTLVITAHNDRAVLGGCVSQPWRAERVWGAIG